MGRDKKNRRSTVGMGGVIIGAGSSMGSKRTVGSVDNNYVSIDSVYASMIVEGEKMNRPERQ